MAGHNLIKEFIDKGKTGIDDSAWIQDWCARFAAAQTEHYRITMLHLVRHSSQVPMYQQALEGITRRLGRHMTDLSTKDAVNKAVNQRLKGTKESHGTVQAEVLTKEHGAEVATVSHAYLVCLACVQECAALLGNRTAAAKNDEDVAFELLMEGKDPTSLPPPSDTELLSTDAEPETATSPVHIPMTKPVAPTPSELAAKLLEGREPQKRT